MMWNQVRLETVNDVRKDKDRIDKDRILLLDILISIF